MKTIPQIAFIFLTAIVLFSTSLFAQKGRILIIGGGSERDTPTGWSNSAYKWAVDKSTNKKVAIINADGTFTPSNFLTTYFTQSLGAVAAKDFTFGSFSAANQAGVYDSLMKYDVIFFRGGDQSRYYLQFKGSEVERAVKDKFNQGGVLAGTSAGLHVLSGIIYTAQNSSIRPDGALGNISSSDITLANDFIRAFPGYIFDSHFHERGRFGRLAAFIARWKKDKNENIKGIGVDDLTALGIDTNGIGTVFGTGAACIFQSISIKSQPFLGVGKLKTDSILVKHILNGWQYHFRKDSIAYPTTGILSSSIKYNSETQQNTILLSGADGLTQNLLLLNQLTTGFSNVIGNCIILTGADSSLAFSFKTQLKSLGANSVRIIPFTGSTTTFSGWKNEIDNTHKYLFINASLSALKTALESDSLGTYLKKKWSQGGNILAFSGGNARFAGERAIGDNYITTDAAYTNALTSTKALGFLRSSIIFPNTFNSDATGENAYAGINYFLLKDSLSYGLWLHGNTVGIYKVKPNGNGEISSIGTVPLLVMQNNGTRYAYNTKTSRGDNTQQPRQVSGFGNLLLSAIDTANPMVIGRNITFIPPTVSTLELSESNLSYFNAFPNPVSDILQIQSQIPFSQWQIDDVSGKKIADSDFHNHQIDVSFLSPGLYFLRLNAQNKSITLKIVKSSL